MRIGGVKKDVGISKGLVNDRFQRDLRGYNDKFIWCEELCKNRVEECGLKIPHIEILEVLMAFSNCCRYYNSIS